MKDSTHRKDIYPKKAEDEEIHRGEWLAYTLMSPHNNNTIYHGFQYLFKSTDQGETWKRISDDLTYNNKEKMETPAKVLEDFASKPPSGPLSDLNAPTSLGKLALKKQLLRCGEGGMCQSPLSPSLSLSLSFFFCQLT